MPAVFCPTDGILPPERYELDTAERSFVVVLADAYVVDRDSGQRRTWSSFIGDLWAACQDPPHRFFPVQLDETAWDFDHRLGGTNFVRAFTKAEKESRDELVVAASNDIEVRRFPYLGNVPVLRWPTFSAETNDNEKTRLNRRLAIAAVNLLLKETLRHLHASEVLEQARQEGDRIFARPPELLRLLRRPPCCTRIRRWAKRSWIY